MGDLSRTYNLSVGQLNVGAADFHSLVDGLELAAAALTGKTAETTMAAADLLLMYDDSASALRKITTANAKTYLAGITGIASTATKTVMSLSDSSFVFNNDGDNVDFRFEGRSDTNLLKLDGGLDKIGIGEGTPLGKLHIKTADAGAISPIGGADELVLEGSGNVGISLYGGTTSDGTFSVGHSGADDAGNLRYDIWNAQWVFRTGSSDRVQLDSDEFRPVDGETINCGQSHSSNTWKRGYGVLGWTTTSSAEGKKQVFDSDLGLAFVKKLRPRRYVLKRDRASQVHYGLVAQEVEKALAQEGNAKFGGLVNVKKPAGEPDYYGLTYDEFIAPIIQAVKELDTRLDAAEALLAL